MSRHSGYLGVAIFDLRETLITTMQTEDQSDTIVGRDKTVSLIKQLQDLGVYVAVCTGDGKDYFEETAQFLKTSGLDIDMEQMYNFDCLQQYYPGKTFSIEDDEYKEAIWCSLDASRRISQDSQDGVAKSVTFSTLKKEQQLNAYDWEALETEVSRSGYTVEVLQQKAWPIFLTDTEEKSKPDICFEILKVAGFEDNYQDNYNVMIFDDGFEQKKRAIYLRAKEYGFTDRQLIAVNSLEEGTLLQPLEAMVGRIRSARPVPIEYDELDVPEQHTRATVQMPPQTPHPQFPDNELPKLVPMGPSEYSCFAQQDVNGEGRFHQITSEALKMFADRLIGVIENHVWHLGSFICLFHGGINIKTKGDSILRVPHRVGGIYNLLREVQEQQEFNPERYVERMKQLLNAAVLKPKFGRDKDTTNFYTKLKEMVQKNDLSVEWIDSFLADVDASASGDQAKNSQTSF